MKDTAEVKQQARSLINICSTPTTRAISKFSLSSTWYSDNAKKDQLEKIGNAIQNLHRKYPKGSILFTMPKDSTVKRKDGRPNSRCAVHRSTDVDEGFLYCGARATNDYANRWVAIHAYNRYVNRVVAAYLQDYGSEVGAVPSDDQFALSEMLQWLYRTRIRKDQPIDVYLLSSRMEKLLRAWLNDSPS
ncbi:hypothetical protein D3C85_820350 [compost metagenome]